MLHSVIAACKAQEITVLALRATAIHKQITCQFNARKSACAKASYGYIKLLSEQLCIVKVIWLVFQKKLCSSLYEAAQEQFRTALGGIPALLSQRKKQ